MPQPATYADPELSISEARSLLPGILDKAIIPQVRTYDVFPDGERFVFVGNFVGEYRSELHIVENWTEELKRLVPTP